MIRILFYAVLVLAGLLVGPTLVANKGYVLVAIGEYTVETSVVGAVLVLLVAFGLLQLLEYLVVKLINLTGFTLASPKRWRRNRSRKHTLQGALALAQQDWDAAERSMSLGAQAGEYPVINYLAAARAAHHRGDPEACERHLAEAEKLPGADKAVRVTRLRYQIDDGELALARQGLEALDPKLRQQPQVLKLALDLYRRQQDWDALARLVPALTKHKVLSESELAALPEEIEVACLAQCPDMPALEQRWQGLSRRLKRAEPVLVAYVQGLARFGEMAQGRKLLLEHLDKSAPQPELLAPLPALSQDAAESVVHILERKYPESDSLALIECYAALAEQDRAWRRAKEWRQKAVEQAPTAGRYRALAQVQEQLGEREGALHSYRQLLSLS
ncbi:heme biosynthesis HemY N-terminal domain-containing protein [Ferrimonas balearica]|uniref:heme biosynthesis HemY N-terminal domain-containing protein n=1 Tax=Ferrimonas balearica TaxID=44012 RepID=UPI001C993B3D|nr:heme biosynthesis HemY N-terminal domain-containing protein [Ferrimonas balearica]MBY5922714.1 heme biosynthesis protein HemY [Ferrimonas balearica]MBY5995698.1 heme biosynthesis protein HemY [Ferrimonas balearica]